MKRKVLRWMAVAEKPAAWGMMFAGLAIFLAVLVGLITTGGAKWATLLVAADVFVSGFSAVQDAEPSLGDSADRMTYDDDMSEHDPYRPAAGAGAQEPRRASKAADALTGAATPAGPESGREAPVAAPADPPDGEERLQDDGSEYPTNGTVDDVTEWAGDDPERIRHAIETESQADKPRKGILALGDRLS